MAGIECNPGPRSVLSTDSDLFISETSQIVEDKCSIVHYNVQSIANKLDLIE